MPAFHYSRAAAGGDGDTSLGATILLGGIGEREVTAAGRGDARPYPRVHAGEVRAATWPSGSG